MTDNPILKEIMKKGVQLPDIDGYVWVNMLIKYNVRTGKASIERSFAKAAEQSKIKNLVKKKKKKVKIDMGKVEKTEELFG